MSVSKWAYKPEKCDGDYCPGDCDNCSKEQYYYARYCLHCGADMRGEME